MLKGACLCGAVSFEIEGPTSAVEVCHCVQCRKWSGHVFASIEVPREVLRLQGGRHITWFHSSAKARRGFCATCGSTLFFDPLDREKHGWIGVAMGALEAPTGLSVGLHIFTAEKGDYYGIDDGAPRH
jgi:hypothetical protein